MRSVSDVVSDEDIPYVSYNLQAIYNNTVRRELPLPEALIIATEDIRCSCTDCEVCRGRPPDIGKPIIIRDTWSSIDVIGTVSQFMASSYCIRVKIDWLSVMDPDDPIETPIWKKKGYNRGFHRASSF